MKNKDKVKKVHESKIGKVIYGFLMFMPLMAILTTCVYTIFNKNAKDSYYGTSINEEISEVTTFTQANKNTLYTIYTNEINKPLEPGQEVVFLCRDINVNNTTYVDYNQINISRELTGDQRYILSIRGENLNSIYGNYGTSNFVITFYLDNLVKNDFNIPLNYFTYNKYSYVSEAFYYSIEQTENSNLFNWAKDSVIYTGMHNFTTQLNVSNTFMPMLLSYWLIVSIIYFLYDIALIMLNIVHRKIHELQDSL